MENFRLLFFFRATPDPDPGGFVHRVVDERVDGVDDEGNRAEAETSCHPLSGIHLKRLILFQDGKK